MTESHSAIPKPAFLLARCVAVLLLMVAGVASAQQVSVPAQTGTPAPAQADADQPPVAVPSYVTPIRGLQGVLAETVDGRLVAAQSEDQTFNPASAVKLATALMALQTFGPQHRYVTGLWTNGKVDESTGLLDGDLILSGRDPSFHHEHAVMLARELNGLGIRRVSGDLIVAPTFTMNFDWSARRSGQQLYDILDASRRPATATLAWIEQRNRVGDTASLNVVPSVTIDGTMQLSPAPPDASLLFTHRSSQMVDILKVLLCYSNNFMAERIGDTLGGVQTVRQLLISRLELNPDDVHFASLSGLGANRLTPRAMLIILRALRSELSRHRLVPADIMPVAGIDPGTLEDRFTSFEQRGSVIAKTGTLITTDRGASSLVGETKTKSGAVVLFVIFNQRGSVLRFRANQDEIVASIQNTLGGPAPFAYRPVALPMRLANTENDVAKRKNEYEPDNK